LKDFFFRNYRGKIFRALTPGAYYVTVGSMVTLLLKRKFVALLLNFPVYGTAEKGTEMQLNLMFIIK
jgi:hypothetical protein